MNNKRLIASIAAASLTLGAFALTGCAKEEGAGDAKTSDSSGGDDATTKPEGE